MSAVAAARLKSLPPPSSDNLLEALSSPVETPVSSEEAEADDDAEEQVLEPQHNVQLCTWRYGKDYVSSESDDQLTVTLNRSTTITLIGSFDFIVQIGRASCRERVF